MKRIEDKSAGVLMPIASLPGKAGIGGFGEEAYIFVDYLQKMGMGIWQILPLNPLGYGNSPYQPFSSYAGDEIYIDLKKLVESGYLDRNVYERERTPEYTDTIDYESVRKYKDKLLRQAFAKFQSIHEKKENYIAFTSQEWVYHYAVFIALKKQNRLRCWNEWPKEQQDWILDRKYDITYLEDEIAYQMFLQYTFYLQWMELKTYANGKGIRIMGDIPIYVGIDSLDVWNCREDFLLGADGKPTFVAGVPPDYFSATGQRWGNPIYNWDNMKKGHFKFWIERLKYSSTLYDIIRIDHFRAFDTYWSIPAECDTAMVGEWLEAPGYELFDEVYKQLPDIQIVVEDLGDLRPEVLELRDHYHFLGMHIAQFSIADDRKPPEHRLIYTGTHDNQTIKGWYNGLDEKTKKKVKCNLRKYGWPWESISQKMVAYTYKSACAIAIVPLYDILGLGDEARINTPGTVGSPNWQWKIRDFSELDKRVCKVRRMLL